MSSVHFRWLPEPAVLKDTEPARPDQARSQPRPSPSTLRSLRALLCCYLPVSLISARVFVQTQRTVSLS
jgi:hypothetical protein